MSESSGVGITSLSLQGFAAKALGLRPGASSPVIEQVADPPEPKNVVGYFEQKGEFNGGA